MLNGEREGFFPMAKAVQDFVRQQYGRCMAWYGMVLYGTVRYGTVRYGMVCIHVCRKRNFLKPLLDSWTESVHCYGCVPFPADSKHKNGRSNTQVPGCPKAARSHTNVPTARPTKRSSIWSSPKAEPKKWIGYLRVLLKIPILDPNFQGNPRLLSSKSAAQSVLSSISYRSPSARISAGRSAEGI